jgi:hypothetical protein
MFYSSASIFFVVFVLSNVESFLFVVSCCCFVLGEIDDMRVTWNNNVNRNGSRSRNKRRNGSRSRSKKRRNGMGTRGAGRHVVEKLFF